MGIIIWIKQREEMRKSKNFSEQHRSFIFEHGDEDDNNLVCYAWTEDYGHGIYCGQDVTHWMPLPELP